MTFDWQDYLALAQRLATEPDDASRRSAVSRAYYAAFHAARLYLATVHGVHTPDRGDVHAFVWSELRRPGRSRSELAAAHHGDRLRVDRRKADYDATVQVNFERLARAATATAAQVRVQLRVS